MDRINKIYKIGEGNEVARTIAFPNGVWERGMEYMDEAGKQDQISRFFQIIKLEEADGITEFFGCD